MSVNTLLIAITAIVSFLSFNNRELFVKLEYNPWLAYHRKQWYRLLSHSLVHGDIMHLIINMFVLWGFGRVVEAWFGSLFGMKGLWFYFVLYLGGVLFASLPALKKHRDNPGYNAVGASGAVSAVLFAAIILQPLSKIYLFFIPIGIPAFIFGPLYLFYEVYMDKRQGDHIAHDAHYYGAIFGLLFPIILKPALLLNFFDQISNWI